MTSSYQALSDKDKVVQGRADLEYVYLADMGYDLATPENMKRRPYFNIDYSKIKTCKDPLIDYEEDFGPSETGRKCSVCKGSHDCQGHRGILEFPISDETGLPEMIVCPTFEDTIKKILCMMCLTCQKLVFSRDDIYLQKALDDILAMPRASRLRALFDVLGADPNKKVSCSNHELSGGKYAILCPSSHVLLKEEKGAFSVCTTVTHTESDKKTKGAKKQGKNGKASRVSARQVYDKLMMLGGRQGHTKDCEYIGITKSELRGMFMTQVSLMALKFRQRTAGRKNCELTKCINKIVSICRDYTGTDPGFSKSLYDAITEYIVVWNKIPGDKSGLYNSNIYGKRPEFNARAVVVPSRHVTFNEIGVPRMLAERALVRREDVYEHNIESLQDLMYAGEITYIQKLIGRNSGRPIRVAPSNISDTSSHALEVGDIVWRHLMDGDVIGAGRQPTSNLHNYWGAIVKVIDGDVFNVDLGVTPGSGMDFDGDQLHGARAQLKEADDELFNMLLGKNNRTDQRNTPVFGLVYNGPLAAALLTFQPIEITRDMYEAATISFRDAPHMTTLDRRLRKHSVDKYSGHGLYSTVLPENFFYENGPGPKHILIRDGILIEGMLTGSTVGAGSGSIVDEMSIMYSGCGQVHCTHQCDKEMSDAPGSGGRCSKGLAGWEVTSNYITYATRMLSVFIDGYGFSVSYSDMLFGTGENVSIILEKKQAEARESILGMKRPETTYEKARYEKDILDIVANLSSAASEANVFAGLDKIPSTLVRHELDKVANEIALLPRTNKSDQRIEIFRIINSIGPDLEPIDSETTRIELENTKQMIELAARKINKLKDITEDAILSAVKSLDVELTSTVLYNLVNKILIGQDPYTVMTTSIMPTLFPQVFSNQYIISNLKVDRAVFQIQQLSYVSQQDYRASIRSIIDILRTVPAKSFIIEGQMIGVNSLVFMSKLVSGAKGSEGNLSNIGVTLGQSLLFGKRLTTPITDNTRMFVTQRPDSMFLQHKGYIDNSYTLGLTPNEVVMASISQRFGLAATNTMTRTIGSMQKNMERIFVDLTTVNGCVVYRGAVVINFAYGEDSMSGKQLMWKNDRTQCASLRGIASMINSDYM